MAAEDFHIPSQIGEKVRPSAPFHSHERLPPVPKPRRKARLVAPFRPKKARRSAPFLPPRRPPTPDPIAEALVAHDGLVLEDVLYRLLDGGGGSTGQTQLDLQVDGATLSPSAAQDDHRPAWPFDTPDLIVQGRIHKLTELRPGQLLQLVSIEHPTGGTSAIAEAYLLCRRP